MRENVDVVSEWTALTSRWMESLGHVLDGLDGSVVVVNVIGIVLGGVE